jgi:hypothetical protein
MSEATLGRANVIIGGALDQLDKDLDSAKGKVETALAGFAKAATAAAAAGFALLAGGLALAVKEAADSQEVLASLDNLLGNLGVDAPISRDALLGFAGAMQDVTRFSDEAIIAGQQVLLGFSQIGGTVFPRAEQAAVDMAAALKTDVAGAAKTLGMALADPTTAAGRLRRSGIALTQSQEDLITAMMAAGDIAGAQGVILDAVEGKYQGAAAAAGQTFAGQLDRLKNKFSDILETIGMAVLPSLQLLAETLLTALSSPEVQAAIQNFAMWLGEKLPLAVDWLLGAINTVAPIIGGFIGTLAGFAAGDTVGAINNLGLALAGLGVPPEAVTAIQDFASGAANVVSQLPGLAGGLAALVTGDQVAGLQQVSDALTEMGLPPEVVTAVQDVGAAIGSIRTAIAENGPAIATFFSDLATALGVDLPAKGDTFAQAMQKSMGLLNQATFGVFPALNELRVWLSERLAEGADIFSGKVDSAIVPSGQEIEDAFNKAVDVAKKLYDQWSIQLPQAWDQFMASPVGKKAQAFWDILAGAVQGVIDAVGRLIAELDKITWPSLPDWMTPGSPTPLELGLRGIAAATAQAAQEFAALLTLAPAPLAAGGGTGAGAGGADLAGATTNMNLTIYSQATTEQVQGDFAVMRALAGR